MSRLVYKWHKWLAVGAGLATLLWFVSGIVMLLPANLLTKPASPGAVPGAVKDASPSFKEIRVSIPQAIAAVEAAVGHEVEVTSFASRRLLGRTLYQISTRKDGPFLIDATDGTRFEVSAETARTIAATAGADRSVAGEAVLLQQYDSDYLYGPLPAYKVAANDDRGTIYFVTVESGEVRSTNTLGRVRGFIAGLHTFAFLRPVASGRMVRLLMLLFALIGTAMSVFGAWILWMQFRNWRQVRRQSA